MNDKKTAVANVGLIRARYKYNPSNALKPSPNK